MASTTTTKNGGSVAERRAALEAKRAARDVRAAERAAEFELQELSDLEALDDLEVELGRRPITVKLGDAWQPGLPTVVAFRLPKPIEFKRFLDMSSKDANDAADKVADVCRVYPARTPEGEKLYTSVREAAAGIHQHGGVAAVKASQGRKAEEGKD